MNTVDRVRFIKTIGKFESFKNDIFFLIEVWNKGYGTNITFDDFGAKTAVTLAKSQC